MDSMEQEATPVIPHQDHVFRGIGFGVAAFFLFSVMGACAKLLSVHHHVIEIAFYRNLIFLCPMLGVLFFQKKLHFLKAKNPKGVAFRGIVGVISLIVTYAAFAALPIADVTVLLFAANLITPVLAHFLLKEYVGIHRWSAIAFGFLGVILIATPTGLVHPWGVFLALSAAVFHASMFITLRYLKTEAPVTVTFYFVLCGVFLPVLFMPFIAHAPESWHEIFLLGVLGISGGVAQFCLSSAMRYAPASLVTPFNYTGLIWASGLDILIWGKVPGWSVFAGAAIIFCANLYILVREARNKKKFAFQ